MRNILHEKITIVISILFKLHNMTFKTGTNCFKDNMEQLEQSNVAVLEQISHVSNCFFGKGM